MAGCYLLLFDLLGVDNLNLLRGFGVTRRVPFPFPTQTQFLIKIVIHVILPDFESLLSLQQTLVCLRVILLVALPFPDPLQHLLYGAHVQIVDELLDMALHYQITNIIAQGIRAFIGWLET